MGTTYAIKLFLHSDSIPLAKIGSLVEEELELVNVQMSTYRDDSEISRFNASDSTNWFPVSPATAQVVQLSLEIHQQTEGRFDVTVGPLVNLWGFGPAKAPSQIPNETAINQLLPNVGSDKLEVRSNPPALRKKVPNLKVDLSAIAKGHGVDRLAAVLDKLQIENYMVEVGGEIRAKGRRSDGRAWQIGIESPSEERRELLQVVQLRDLSMATSGDYRNLRYLGDSKFSHFIDPQTGWPVRSEIASATVLAEDCAKADAIATGLMSSDREHALKLIEAHGWSVLLIVRQGEGFETISSPGFQQKIAERSDVGDRVTQ
jgi:FAD:protein FMN transferase